MKALGWALAAATVLLVASTRRSEASGPACDAKLADRANRLRILADVEIRTLPGQPVADPVDPAELEQVASIVDACLAKGAFPPTTPSPADELRQRAALIRVRRGALGPGPKASDVSEGAPGTPATPATPLDAIVQAAGQLIGALSSADPKDPGSQALSENALRVADELDRAGLAAPASRVRKAAEELRARMGLPPAASGRPPHTPPAGAPPDQAQTPLPSTLPADIAARIQTFTASPDADPNAVDMLADTIATTFPGGFLTEIGLLRRRAIELRALRRKPSLADAQALFRLATTSPAAVSPSTLDAVADAIAADDEVTAQGLKIRANEIRKFRNIPA